MTAKKIKKIFNHTRACNHVRKNLSQHHILDQVYWGQNMGIDLLREKQRQRQKPDPAPANFDFASNWLQYCRALTCSYQKMLAVFECILHLLESFFLVETGLIKIIFLEQFYSEFEMDTESFLTWYEHFNVPKLITSDSKPYTPRIYMNAPRSQTISMQDLTKSIEKRLHKSQKLKLEPKLATFAGFVNLWLASCRDRSVTISELVAAFTLMAKSLVSSDNVIFPQLCQQIQRLAPSQLFGFRIPLNSFRSCMPEYLFDPELFCYTMLFDAEWPAWEARIVRAPSSADHNSLCALLFPVSASRWAFYATCDFEIQRALLGTKLAEGVDESKIPWSEAVVTDRWHDIVLLKVYISSSIGEELALSMPGSVREYISGDFYWF